MKKPKIAVKSPKIMEMEPGTYWWCSCGESNNQPFCDGTHKLEGEFKPMEIEIKNKQSVYWCQCKNSKNKPFCDGTHKDL
jgi:CDGSH iron-sulfur domain-containing protein 3